MPTYVHTALAPVLLLVSTACSGTSGRNIHSIDDCGVDSTAYQQLSGTIELSEASHDFDHVQGGISVIRGAENATVSLLLCGFDGWWESTVELTLETPRAGSGDVALDTSLVSVWTEELGGSAWSLSGSGSVDPADTDAGELLLEIDLYGDLIASSRPEEPPPLSATVSIDATWEVVE